MQARAKISAPRRYLRQVGTRKDGSSMQIMAGSAALSGMRSVVETHLHVGFITISSRSLSSRDAIAASSRRRISSWIAAEAGVSS